MVRLSHIESKVAVFMLLFCTLLLGQIFACSTTRRSDKQNRYYRRHKYERYYHKRSTDHEKVHETNNQLLTLNTNCGDVLCDSVLDYPHEMIRDAVKQLREIHESKTASSGEEIKPHITKYLSRHLKSKKSSTEFSHIADEESRGCKAFGNVSFPHEAFTIDYKQIYFVVNVPNLQQTANLLWCKISKTECGDDIRPPDAEFRTCQQVSRIEYFMVLPNNRSQYSVDDFEIRPLLVPDGCKCFKFDTSDNASWTYDVKDE